MSDSQFTRCPGCATVYRVTETQLALREGQVRCGHCRAVFDATAHRIDLAATVPNPSPESHLGQDDELARGRATVTLRDASALEVPDEVPEKVAQEVAEEVPEKVAEEVAEEVPEKVAEPSDDGPVSAPEPPLDTPDTASESQPDPGTATPVDVAALEAARKALRSRRPRARSGATFYAVAIAVLVLGLAVQLAALFRDAIVMRVPQAAAALDVLCGAVTCLSGARRDSGALSIEGSDLRADPAHSGLLVLTATLRNHGSHAVAWPDIELSLTDSSDQTVVRRVLAPGDYLSATADQGGLDAHSERQISLFLDASATRQAGYRLYLFYP